jgi:hypothetical protein
MDLSKLNLTHLESAPYAFPQTFPLTSVTSPVQARPIKETIRTISMLQTKLPFSPD